MRESSRGAWELGLSGELPRGNSLHLDGAGLHGLAVVRPTDVDSHQDVGTSELQARSR